MKRNKDSHQLAHSSSFRYQQRPSPPPYLVEDGESSSEHSGGHMTPFACPLEVNTSPLPTSPAFLKYTRDRSNSSCSHYRESPYDLSIYSPDADSNPLRRNSDPMARNTDFGVLSPSLPMDMEEDYDQPLDMSKKSRILSSSSSSSSPPSESHHPSNHHHHQLNHHRHHSLHHHHGSTSSSSSSSTSSRSNTCSPESIYKGNHINSNNKSFIGSRQNSILHNQPHHLYHQSPPQTTINSPTKNLINQNKHHNSQDGNPHLQPRPSVITCASTLFGPRRSTSSTSSNQHHPHHQTICSNNNFGKDESVLYPSHHNQHLHHHQINSGLTSSDKTLNTGSPRPSSLASTSSSSSLSSFSSSSSSCSSYFNRHHQSLKSQTLRPETANDANSFNTNGKKRLDEPKKLVIHGEDSDSGIDEHFRRSLGDHYRNYTNVSMSVDDHFAKALGDTWLKLKRESQNGSKGNSYNKANAATVPS